MNFYPSRQITPLAVAGAMGIISASMNLLEHSWNLAWTTLGVPSSPALLQLLNALQQSYSEPHRSYHTLQHLGECLELALQDGQLAARPAEVTLALWFHDAVYQTRRNDNEFASANWARTALLSQGVQLEAAQRVHALVMATRHQDKPSDTQDAQLVVDIDLAILGAETDRFDEYERQVRQEYRWVPNIVFRRKRASMLEAMLNRGSIFSTQEYAQRYEAKARSNLQRSIGKLRGPTK